MSEGSSGGTGGRAGRGQPPTGCIGRYQILERIAEGGMGSLYLARDPALERLLAIKVLRHGFDTEELRERFAREARAAGRLRHPNIVTIFDIGEHHGDPFIAMEFLPGETLAELIRSRAQFALTRRLQLLEELCDGLAYAHRAGMVHRDVKPANLMVNAEGMLKILDFGIVRLGDSGMTQQGVLVGTLNYMSPEQVMGGAIDARSDIFAVGLVGYELLSYAQAFPGTQGLFNKILSVTIEPLSALCPALDPAIVAIIDRALKREPGDRYQDLARMRNDLSRVRTRLEAEAERAGATGGETAVFTAIGGDATPPPIGEPLRTPPIVRAERALVNGEYRSALTLAARSAALDPGDAAARVIVERAHSALLERGRQTGLVPAGPPGAEAAPVVGAAAPASASGSAMATLRTQPLNRAAVGIAAVALLAAGAAVYLGLNSNRAAQPRAPAAPIAAPDHITASAPAAEPRQDDRAGPVQKPSPSLQERRTAAPAAPAPQPRAADPGVRNVEAPPAEHDARAVYRAGVDVDPPRRIKVVDPVYPESARRAGVEGTVVLELTIGREGRVADVRVVKSVPLLDQPALVAVRQWEFVPTEVGGMPVPVTHTVPITFELGRSVSPPEPSVPPPAVVAPAPAPTRRDPAADENAVRDVLQRYKAAWESLNVAALTSVQRLSDTEAARVRQSMAATHAYSIDIDVQDLQISLDGRQATAVGRVVRRFTPRVGRASDQTVVSTFRLEKQGEAWMIVGIQ